MSRALIGITAASAIEEASKGWWGLGMLPRVNTRTGLYRIPAMMVLKLPSTVKVRSMVRVANHHVRGVDQYLGMT